MHEKPSCRRTFGYNATQSWDISPCLCHHHRFKRVMVSTGMEHMSDTVKFKHHTITITELTPANRILEAAQQLDSATKHQPKRLPMDKITAIKLLQTVLLGEKQLELPPIASIFRGRSNLQCPRHGQHLPSRHLSLPRQMFPHGNPPQ